MSKLVSWVKDRWGIVLLSAILLFIIGLNVKPGYVVLGNDNFSPELDPQLTFERQVYSPAWRTHRVLGIPSDSEQADIFRAGLYMVLEKALPIWVVSQGYLFFTFFIASFSMSHVAVFFVHLVKGDKYRQSVALIGGLLYMATMLTSWIYFFPVHLFVAAYAFLPFVLWRLTAYISKQSVGNTLWLLVASIFLATSALTATMFLVGALVLSAFAVLLFLQLRTHHSLRNSLLVIFSALFIVFGTQAFWALPFATYVKSNTAALRESGINRDITSSTIENEARHNTAFNTIRYFASWMDTKEDNLHFTFTYRDWYKNSILATLLSIIPIILALVGAWFVVRRKDKKLLVIPILAFLGWFFIKGINPPFGFVYSFVQENFPVVAQVFRWQSSKMWPFLALTLPVLGSIGLVRILSFLQKEPEEAPLIVKRPDNQPTGVDRNLLKVVGVVVVVVASLLVYVYPYFTGNLVRDNVFVQVPREYKELADYLKKTDTQSRIYISPEANTLYFRNYSWGFWGSVVLNYVLPNPIIEKALIIGSFENEQAFQVLTNAYFSENPSLFTRALLRYQTPYVLSDKYAAPGLVGYPYDWDLHTKVIENNPDFEVVWQKGKLTLYKVKNYPSASSGQAQPVYADTDFTKLNTILQTLGTTTPYYTNAKTSGTVYPFALSYTSYEYTPLGLKAQTKYKGPASLYTASVTQGDIISSPSKLSYSVDNKEIIVEPVLPIVGVNNKVYQYSVPSKRYGVKNPSSFITVDEQVIDMRATTSVPRTTGILYGGITDSSLKTWTGVFEPLELLRGRSQFLCSDKPQLTNLKVGSTKIIKCKTPDIAITKDTVVEANVRVKVSSAKPVQTLICFESIAKKTCLNRNNNMFVKNIGEATILIPWKIGQGDTLRVYIDFKAQEENTTVSIEQFAVRLYSQSEVVTRKTETEASGMQVFEIPLKTNDAFSLTIPLLEGPNSSPMRSDGALIPEASAVAYEEGKQFTSLVEVSKDGLEITNVESNSSVYPRLSYLDPRGGMALLFIDADHKSGIPLDVSLRNVQKPHRVWQQKMPYKKDGQKLDIFLLPEEIQSYYLELFSTGIGPRASTTVIKALYFQIVPMSWYGFKLDPEPHPIGLQSLSQVGEKDSNRYSGEVKLSQLGRGKAQGIVTIPTALSNNWKLTMNGQEAKERVVVNGWQQGWMVGKGGKAEVVFGPSVLVYIGFAPIILILGWIVLQSVSVVSRRFKK